MCAAPSGVQLSPDFIKLAQRGSSGVSGPLCSVQALEQMKKM